MQHSNNAGCSSFNTIYYHWTESLPASRWYPDSYPGEIGMWIQLLLDRKLTQLDIADKALPFVAKIVHSFTYYLPNFI